MSAWILPSDWTAHPDLDLDSDQILAVLDEIPKVWAGAMQSLAETPVPGEAGADGQVVQP